MKTLMLMRHAKSSWKDEKLDDFDRPLNRRGRRDAPFMGKILALKSIRPGMIVSSPAVRALATAIAVAEELGYPANYLKTEKRLYEAPARQILQVIREWTDPVDNVLLVAHNPGLTNLANLLACAELANIPTAGIVSVDLDVEHWSDTGEGRGNMRWFEYPKKFLRD